MEKTTFDVSLVHFLLMFGYKLFSLYYPLFLISIGFSILNDYSCRDLQKNHSQWFRGKCMDTHTVIGPVIVSCDEIKKPVELDLKSVVNVDNSVLTNCK